MAVVMGRLPFFQVREIIIETLGARFPEAPTRVVPIGDFLDPSSLEPTPAPLGLPSAGDQTGRLEHPEVLGNTRSVHQERRPQFLASDSRSSRLAGGFLQQELSEGPREHMERFARIIVGYHGCSEDFARKLLLGKQLIGDWKPSENRWDWLGKGIYFWEHSPERALRWAKQRFRGRRAAPSVVGAIVQLGDCFDLTNEGFVQILGDSFKELRKAEANERDHEHQGVGSGIEEGI
jgi:hypothetical protein